MSLWYIIVAFVFFASILIAKNTKKKKKNLPPGPPRLPIIGNLHQLGSKPHRSMFKLSEKYGSLMSLKFGNVSTVVASTPETVNDVLKKFDVDCCSRPYMTYAARITYNLNDLAYSPYSKYWREVRKLTVLELYTAKRVKSFRHIREEEVASLVDFIEQSASLEKSINLNQKLLRLSGSVICRVGFGITLEGSKLENTYEEVMQGTMEVLGSFAAADSFPVIGKIIDRIMGLHSKCEKVFKLIDTFFDQAIKHHLEDESKDDIIDLLLKMERGEIGLGEFQLTRNHTKGILLNLLIAGVETSGHTVTWVMTHLITNPRVLKKAQTEVRRVIKNKEDITEEDIERLESIKDDIIDLLLKMERGEIGLGEFQLTRNHTKGILLNLLIAGVETSGHTVTWVMTHLITNPRVLKKAQAEVRRVIKNKDDITEEDIERLEYLKMVIKETLRINPLVPLLIPREASKDLKIGGYDIPKKTWIHVNVWAIHRNPNVWKDPEAFIPERFMDSKIDYTGLNFELLPFGSGRRICPGMGIGMSLVHLTLINLLYRFDWKLPKGINVEDVDLEELYGLACPKKVPLQLIPILTKWT
ncbi:Cytochrome P450 71B14 [Cardamine amara subsp. amara]|uniref:Cytochrome P450 71B14 n=1 Tax=Cardamine amara subsp. amara TaxID=228776 RepID=A0ABD1BHG9_CARAN